MKSGVKNIMLVVAGVAFTYLGITSLMKDMQGDYINLADETDSSTSVFYTIIGVLLLIMAFVSLYKEYMADKINRKRYRF